MKFGSVMDLATKDVKTIPPRSTIMNALKTMVNCNFRRMPVADAGTKRLEGIISATDLVNYFGGGEKHRIVIERFNGNLSAAVNEYVDEIMVREVVVVDCSSSWQDALELMLERRVGGCPIVDEDDKVVGIITEKDMLNYLANHRELDGYVRDYMTTGVITANPETTIEEAMKVMISKRIRRLPVIKDGILLGLITAREILRYFTKEAFKVIETGDVRDALQKPLTLMLSKEGLHREPLTFRPLDRISDVVRRMVAEGVGVALIVEDGRLEGIITERDLMKFLYSKA